MGRVVGYTLLALTLVAGLVGVYGYRQLSAKIQEPDYDYVEALLENTGPKGAIDILVMGRHGPRQQDRRRGGRRRLRHHDPDPPVGGPRARVRD